ncbi:MAG: NAD(P)H-dependent oxidoreductase subunit E [Sulfurimonas sp.]|nr:MAG: NAD(P)H-dependent oxidoreductase subunit E [Sulfurimonas sp.]
MSFVFTKKNTLKIQELKKSYPKKKALILPLLWMVQKQDNFISEAAMKKVADITEQSYIHIYGVVTFYTMFRLNKPEKKIIEVCRTLSCELNGSEDIKAYLDYNYSNEYEILEVECMGACSGAPMCTLNGKYMENVTKEELTRVLK